MRTIRQLPANKKSLWADRPVHAAPCMESQCQLVIWRCRRTRCRIFPVAVRGICSSVMKSIVLGHLKPASRLRHHSRKRWPSAGSIFEHSGAVISLPRSSTSMFLLRSMGSGLDDSLMVTDGCACMNCGRRGAQFIEQASPICCQSEAACGAHEQAALEPCLGPFGFAECWEPVYLRRKKERIVGTEGRTVPNPTHLHGGFAAMTSTLTAFWRWAGASKVPYLRPQKRLMP